MQGRPIDGYEIGYGKNTLLLFASIHGNEMGTADLLNQLVLEIALDKNLVSKNKKLLIIPVANPDGYQERLDNLNANGANLNLNFGTSDWQNYGPEGNYAGASPFSEKESQAIKEIVEKYKPKAIISFHSHGNLISPEKGDVSAALAKWYSEKTGYAYFDAWDYPGTATKWFVESTGNPAITVEISKDFQSDWEINKGALLELVSSDNWPFEPAKYFLGIFVFKKLLLMQHEPVFRRQVYFSYNETNSKKNRGTKSSLYAYERPQVAVHCFQAFLR